VIGSALRTLWLVARRAFWRRSTELVYRYCRETQGQGVQDPNIVCYDAANLPPEHLARELFPSGGLFGFNLMRRRMNRRGARALCLIEDGQVMGWGWVQDWQPFRRKYRRLAANARMLGPYMTFPAFRGRGVYGRLLKHSITVCEDRDRVPLLIFVRPHNHSSIRGIEKAGFRKLGCYTFTSVLFGLMNFVSVTEPETPATGQAP